MSSIKFVEFRHNESYAYIACTDEETNMFFNEINSNCLKFVCSFLYKKPFQLKIKYYTEQRLQKEFSAYVVKHVLYMYID